MGAYFPLVIVGHVDHGKSTLIGRLLYDTNSLPEEKIREIKKTCEMLGKDMEFAYVMDYLEEERKQGITIDTSQIFFKTSKRNYVIIDAPGHKEFLKNMITGASQAKAAILIVDAREGVREQTKRHAYVLSLLGIREVIVAINKMDLVDYDKERFEEVAKDIESFLRKVGITPKHTIPISAKEGENIAKKSEKMPWYNGETILSVLDSLEAPKKPIDQPLRFPVQDIYNWDGKTILVGRVESGEIKEGMEATILPQFKRIKVKTIEVWKSPKDGKAGRSIGITIEGLENVERGDIICDKDNLPTKMESLRATVFWMDRNPLNKGETLTLRCATQEVKAVVEKIENRMDSSSLEIIEKEEAKQLQETEIATVSLSLEKPIFVEDFSTLPELGRFVLERDGTVVGGGTIKLG